MRFSYRFFFLSYKRERQTTVGDFSLERKNVCACMSSKNAHVKLPNILFFFQKTNSGERFIPHPGLKKEDDR